MSGSVLKILSQLQSVPFNGSVNSDSLRPYCVQHIRLHCPSPTPRACLKFKPIKMVMPSNHLILCHPLLPWPSIFPCIRVFSNEPVFASDGQSIGASALVLPRNIQDWFPLALTALISLQSKGLSRVFPNTTDQTISSSVLSFLYGPTLPCIHDDCWENLALTYGPLSVN